jgi:hypothetical protein
MERIFPKGWDADSGGPIFARQPCLQTWRYEASRIILIE